MGRAYQPEAGAFDTFLGVFWTGGILLYLAYLASLLVGVLLVAPAIADGILSSTCAWCLGFIFFVNPLSESFFEVVAIGGSGFLIYFALQFALVIGLFVFLFVAHGPASYRDLRLPLGNISEKARSRSTLVVVGQVFMALIFFDTFYFLLVLPALGIDPSPPDFFQQAPTWYLMYSLIDASIWEEIAVRLLFIGLPLTIGSLLVRIAQASSPSALEAGSRSRHILGSLRYLLGGQVSGKSPRPVQLTAAALLLLSAILFGYLHVLSWEVGWKFVDTFVGGLALGYLFLRKGLAASILLHFSINASTVLLTAVGGEANLGATALLGLVSLAFAILGLGFFLFYAKEVGKFIFRSLVGRPRGVGQLRAEERAPPRARVQPPLYSVVCPSCGGQEAVYRDGSLVCANCGANL